MRERESNLHKKSNKNDVSMRQVLTEVVVKDIKNPKVKSVIRQILNGGS